MFKLLRAQSVKKNQKKTEEISPELPCFCLPFFLFPSPPFPSCLLWAKRNAPKYTLLFDEQVARKRSFPKSK